MGFHGDLLRRDRPFFSCFHGLSPAKASLDQRRRLCAFQRCRKGAYRFHYMTLERLLELPPKTTVILCSDHGFESGSQRLRERHASRLVPPPGTGIMGILMMAGTGIKRDERIYGASLIDVAPTVLHCLFSRSAKIWTGVLCSKRSRSRQT